MWGVDRNANQASLRKSGVGGCIPGMKGSSVRCHQDSRPLPIPSSAGTSLATGDRGLPLPMSRKDSKCTTRVPRAVGMGTLISRNGEERTSPSPRPCRVGSQEHRPLGPSRRASLGHGDGAVGTVGLDGQSQQMSPPGSMPTVAGRAVPFSLLWRVTNGQQIARVEDEPVPPTWHLKPR